MITHLKKHICAGNKVPQRALDRLEEDEKKEMLEGMAELAHRHCWRCDPDDYETKRLIMEPRESYGKEDLHWFCPKCENYFHKVTDDELKKENDMTEVQTGIQEAI